MAISAEVRVWMFAFLSTVLLVPLSGYGQDTQDIKVLCAKAEARDAIAQCRLGDCYYGGREVSKDLVQAVRWYRKAAEQGNAQAQLSLGLCYHNGEGVARDMSQAVEWYRKAAESGNVQAQASLGLCCYNGDGIAKDFSQAVKWYMKAAKSGNAQAQYSLGLCYHNGEGVDKDIPQAKEWYIKAAELGNVQAQAAYCMLAQSGLFDVSKIRGLHFAGVTEEIEEQSSGFVSRTDIHYKCVVPGEEIRPILEHLIPVTEEYDRAFKIGSQHAQLDYDGKEIGIHWMDVKMRPRIVLVVTIDGRTKQMLDDPYGEQFLDSVNKHYEETGRTPHQPKP